MPTNLEKYRKDLEKLTELGAFMELDLIYGLQEQLGELSDGNRKQWEPIKGKFENEFQNWYTQALSVVKQLIPDRLAEFVELYRGDGKRKSIDVTTYHIQDWLNGRRAGVRGGGKKMFDDSGIVIMRLGTQLAILNSVAQRFDSSLFDIRQLVQADLLDSELDAARELNKHGFGRAAGAVAGVVLEKHLGQVCSNHSIAIKKRDPGISDLNEALKSANVVDIPVWRQIQHLADLRNLCDHNKHREPTKDDVDELIRGADKMSKTLF